MFSWKFVSIKGQLDRNQNFAEQYLLPCKICMRIDFYMEIDVEALQMKIFFITLKAYTCAMCSWVLKVIKEKDYTCTICSWVFNMFAKYVHQVWKWGKDYACAICSWVFTCMPNQASLINFCYSELPWFKTDSLMAEVIIA